MEILAWAAWGKKKPWRNFSLYWERNRVSLPLLCGCLISGYVFLCGSLISLAGGRRQGSSLIRGLHRGWEEKGIRSILLLHGGYPCWSGTGNRLHCFQGWPKVSLLEEKDKEGTELRLSKLQHDPMAIPHIRVRTSVPSEVSGALQVPENLEIPKLHELYKL